MSSDKDAFIRCDKHGLTYDPRIAKGCVLCRKQSEAIDATAPSYGFFKFIGVFVVVGLGLMGLIYVKTVGFSVGDVMEAAAKRPLKNQVRGVGHPPDAGLDSAFGTKDPLDVNLRPYDALLWGGLSPSFQEYYGGSSHSIRELGSGFGINLFVPPTGPQLYLARERLYGKRPSPAQVEGVGNALLRVLHKYPLRFAQRIGLHHLVLMVELRRDGEAAGAFTMAPAFALFADPNAITAEADMHHHLFHLIDYQVHGAPPEHDDWFALGPKGFSYRKGGRTPQRHVGATANRLLATRCNTPGFASEHAQVDASEDMAETFSQLMTHREALLACTKNDAVLAAKVQYILNSMDRVSPGTSAALGL